MTRFARLLLAAALTAAVLSIVIGFSWGQCPGGRCGGAPALAPGFAPILPPLLPAIPAAPHYQWRADPGAAWWGLFADGTQVGSWSPAKDEYRPFLGGSDFGAATDCPAAKPGGRCSCLCADCACRRSAPPAGTNFGVDRSKIDTQHEHYRIGGREVPRRKAVEALSPPVGRSGPQVPLVDDSQANSLTVIGSAAACKTALADLDQPQFAAWKKTLLVQEYRPEEWVVARAGFVTSGDPTLYLERPTGEVLCRVDAYEGTRSFEAVRKADPNYQPEKDPTPAKPKPPASPDLIAGMEPVEALTVSVGSLLSLTALLLSFRR